MDPTREARRRQPAEGHWWFASRPDTVCGSIKELKPPTTAVIPKIGYPGGPLMQRPRAAGHTNPIFPSPKYS